MNQQELIFKLNNEIRQSTKMNKNNESLHKRIEDSLPEFLLSKIFCRSFLIGAILVLTTEFVVVECLKIITN